MFPFSKPSKHHQHYDIVIQKCQIIVTKFTSSICANIHEQPFTKRYPHNNNTVHVSSPTRTDVSLSYVLKNPQITLGGVYKKCSALSVWVCSKCSIQHSISPGTIHVTTRSQARPAWQEQGPHPPHHNIANFATNIWRCLTTNTKIKSQSHVWPHDASCAWWCHYSLTWPWCDQSLTPCQEPGCDVPSNWHHTTLHYTGCTGDLTRDRFLPITSGSRLQQMLTIFMIYWLT